MNFVRLIESSYSETGTTSKDLQDFFASLQQLSAFSEIDRAGGLIFPLDRQQDDTEFLKKLSQTFELHKLDINSIALHSVANPFKTEEEFWALLRHEAAQDSLQALFDRTTMAGSWQLIPDRKLQQLTVRLENVMGDAIRPSLDGNLNFDFNQSVRLTANDASGSACVLTLEPREVVEFRSIDNAGHYVLYVKDDQWFRHDDHKVQALDQMPAIPNVRMINFAITKSEPAS